LFQIALAINFVMIAGYSAYIERATFKSKLSVLPPVLPSEFASAMLAVAVVFIYHVIGIAAIALFGVVLVTFQYLLGQLLLSQRRAIELEKRSNQLASFSRQEEELVHIAALLHDIGKFILPDRILKANVPLTDEDWMLIKRHP